MAYKQNKNNTGRTSQGGKNNRNAQSYSKGNSNWNNASYKQSVKTNRTQTKVINTTSVRVKTDYFDYTAAGKRAAAKREYNRRRKMWREAVRKNLMIQKAKRVFVYSLTLVLTVGILFTAVYKLFFVADNIIIEGNSIYTQSEIIEAGGLDERKNLFSFSSREMAEQIYFYCPQIKTATFERMIPNRVSITVEEDEPCYFSEIHGELFALSDSLRVLNRISEQDAEEQGLIKLKLQNVAYAVSGSTVQLVSSRAQRYLENTVELIENSTLKSKLTAVDMTDDFDTVMVAESKYKLEFGSQDDMAVKLKLAQAILEDVIFNSQNKAVIDLTDTSKTSVIIDDQLVLD